MESTDAYLRWIRADFRMVSNSRLLGDGLDGAILLDIVWTSPHGVAYRTVLRTDSHGDAAK